MAESSNLHETDDQNKWIPQVRRQCPCARILLVGTQTDLRDDVATINYLAKRNQTPVTMEQGEQAARDMEVVKYLECSALTQDGLNDVFDEAILAHLNYLDSLKTKSTPKCTIL